MANKVSFEIHFGEIECPKFIPQFFVRSFTDIFPKSVDRNSDSISYFKIDPAARKVKVSIDAGVRHDILLTKICKKS